MSKKTTPIETIDKKLQAIYDDHREMKLREHTHNIENDKHKVLADLCRELDIICLSNSEHAVLVEEAEKTDQKIKKKVTAEINTLTSTLQNQMDHLMEVAALKHSTAISILEEKIKYLELRVGVCVEDEA